MCGIVGYTGRKDAAPRLYAGLRRLEYRGYDSAGIATLDGGAFRLLRCTGPVAGLKGGGGLPGTCGIGHTRWATHGAPTVENAHPHIYRRFAVVHNGIIENWRMLRAECEARGEEFASETDSEVIAHLLEETYDGDLLAALRSVCTRLEGSYAVAVLARDRPGTIALARNKSPLIAGYTKDGLVCASDIPAVAKRGAELYALADGEFALLENGRICFYGAESEIGKSPLMFDPERDIPAKGGHPFFMEKEMEEIPAVLRSSRPNFADFARNSEFYRVLCQAEYIELTACGSAYHACLAAQYAIESLARVRAGASVASEYRYRDPILPDRTLMLAVSQSGETADTLAAAKLAKERGAKVAAVVNAESSSLARLADFVLPIHAGREIAVAATKSFNAQLVTLYSIAATLAESRGLRGYGDALKSLPELAEKALDAARSVRGWAAHFVGARCCFFIGRGADYITACEGSLKLREISYLPAEGYPAGELKHGTLALIEENTPVVAVLTSRRLAEKTMNAVAETRARGAKVFLVTSLEEYAEAEGISASVLIPGCGEVFSPALAVIPLQQLAYSVALACGHDPDKPRNLAKSVTVE